MSAELDPTLSVPVLRLEPGAVQEGRRSLATETPIAISFLGIGYAVMMATPSDLEDFGVGFALSERIIDHREQIVDISLLEEAGGILLNIEVSREREDAVLKRVRHRVSESSCGMCGIENLDQALRPLPKVSAPPPVSLQQLFRSLEVLGQHQPLNSATGAVHAAAFFRADGSLLAAREDVGRHNAFDKLIGHALRTDINLAEGYALLTARCSYELVEKAALAGIPMMLTISAPTTLAVQRAAEAELTLISLARPDSMLVMTDPYGVVAKM